MEEITQSRSNSEAGAATVTEENHEASAFCTTGEGIKLSVLNDGDWERINMRRCELIRRKHTMGISPEELVELTEIDQLATVYLNAVAPTSSYPLDRLQYHADRIRAAAKNGS